MTTPYLSFISRLKSKIIQWFPSTLALRPRRTGCNNRVFDASREVVSSPHPSKTKQPTPPLPKRINHQCAHKQHDRNPNCHLNHRVRNIKDDGIKILRTRYFNLYTAYNVSKHSLSSQRSEQEILHVKTRYMCQM